MLILWEEGFIPHRRAGFSNAPFGFTLRLLKNRAASFELNGAQ